MGRRSPCSGISTSTGLLDLRNDFTVYDAAYIVLAQALDAPLVTSDAKMREATRLGADVHVFPAPDRAAATEPDC